MKKLVLLFSLLFSLFLFTSCSDNEAYDVVTTNFVCYDAVRASTLKTDIKVKMIIKPGAEIHDYELSMADTRAILGAKMFVYVGGESDVWADKVVADAKAKGVKIISMFEILEDSLLLEEGEEDEYDEHVWTDPSNYERIVKVIGQELSYLFPDVKDYINTMSEAYRIDLTNLDLDIKNLVSKSTKKMIVVADRNPFLYFGTHYGIKVYGALSGCSTDGTASSEKIIELKNVVEQNKINTIFTIELSNGSIANTLSNEIDKDIRNNSYDGEKVSIRTLFSMHNISKNDFETGITYVTMLRKNFEVLNTALS